MTSQGLFKNLIIYKNQPPQIKMIPQYVLAQQSTTYQFIISNSTQLYYYKYIK